MSNPVIINLPKEEWVKVASGVRSGQVSITGNRPAIIVTTHRVAGDPAPTDAEEGVPISGKSILIASDTLIDAYCYARVDKGTVRVDL